jgi:hypothetical protein
MFMGGGIQRAEGHMGFDWGIHKDDPLPADSDMEFSGLLPESLDNNRDRFDFVESLSGWDKADILRGDDRVAADRGPEHTLTAEGVGRIAGLSALAPAGYNAGNIILGGASGDTIEGRGGDDIIDGDLWLNVRLSVRTNPNDPATEIGSADGMSKPYLTGSTTTLQQAVFAGTVDPGNIVIVRELLAGTGGTDTAVFSGPRADYDITFSGGVATVIHARGTAADGTDRVSRVEALQFTDQTVQLAVPPAPGIGTASAASSTSATVNWTAPVLPAGSQPITSYEIVVSDGTVIAGIPANLRTRVVNGLTAGTAYTFQVRAVNAIGAGPLSAASNSVTPTAAVGPQITARTPVQDATGVAVNANVTATFDSAMAAAGFTTGTVRLTNPAGQVIASAVTYSGTNRRVTLNPSANLAGGTRYTVTLTGGTGAIRSSTGVPFTTTSWSFTTASPAPTVTTTTPLAGATNVLRGANITANFSQAVVGVSGSTVVLTNATTGAVIPAVVTTNATSQRAILNPNANLARNTLYRVTLTGGPAAIRSAATGAPLATMSWTFTTAP